MNEQSALEVLAEELSTDECDVLITATPKFHCEIAGEGIERGWGLSKSIAGAYQVGAVATDTKSILFVLVP